MTTGFLCSDNSIGVGMFPAPGFTGPGGPQLETKKMANQITVYTLTGISLSHARIVADAAADYLKLDVSAASHAGDSQIQIRGDQWDGLAEQRVCDFLAGWLAGACELHD